MAEYITMKKTRTGQWFKRFDDYENRFWKITKAEAHESLKTARETKRILVDCDENKNEYQMYLIII